MRERSGSGDERKGRVTESGQRGSGEKMEERWESGGRVLEEVEKEWWEIKRSGNPSLPPRGVMHCLFSNSDSTPRSRTLGRLLDQQRTATFLKLLNRTFGHTIQQVDRLQSMNQSNSTTRANPHSGRSPTLSPCVLFNKEEILEHFVYVHSLFPATTMGPDGTYKHRRCA